MYKLKLFFYRFFRNLFYISPIGKRLKDYRDNNDRKILELRMALVKFHRPDLRLEADYLLQNGYCQYPYRQLKEIDKIEAGFDKKEKLPYVVHNGNKLYFPKKRSVEWCKKYYEICICKEAFLGGQYMEKQPHQYQSERCCIHDGDILVDIGCAEALLTLDNIDKVSYAFLFECDSQWIKPLMATFRNFHDKVSIIEKSVGGSDTKTTITLKNALKDSVGKNLFVKMDIEGAEVDVIKGNKEFLSETPNVKLAVCTYHRHDDADIIQSIYEEMGFNYEFSDGWMYLSKFDKNDMFPYFRKGVIRGWRY